VREKKKPSFGKRTQGPAKGKKGQEREKRVQRPKKRTKVKQKKNPGNRGGKGGNQGDFRRCGSEQGILPKPVQGSVNKGERGGTGHIPSSSKGKRGNRSVDRILEGKSPVDVLFRKNQIFRSIKMGKEEKGGGRP